MDFNGVCDFIFKKFPIRFNRSQKDEFSVYLSKLLVKIGYSENEVSIIKMKDTVENNNIIAGDPEKADYYVVSHYDTPGKIGYLRFLEKLLGRSLAWCVVFLIFALLAFLFMDVLVRIQPDMEFAQRFIFSFLWLVFVIFVMFAFPALMANKNNKNTASGMLAVIAAAEKVAADEELKDKVCFILFDNSEWGMMGSSAFVKWCKKNKINPDEKTVFAVEKVGCGDRLTLFTLQNPRKNNGYEKLSEALSESDIDFYKAQSSTFFLGDHMQFKNGVMLCSAKSTKLKTLYIPNVGTSKDVICNKDYVNWTGELIYNILAKKPIPKFKAEK